MPIIMEVDGGMRFHNYRKTPNKQKNFALLYGRNASAVSFFMHLAQVILFAILGIFLCCSAIFLYGNLPYRVVDEKPLYPEAWPATVETAAWHIISLLSKSEKQLITNTPHNELATLEDEMGRRLIDYFGLSNGNTRLVQAACGRRCSPQDASHIIIEEIWKLLNSANEIRLRLDRVYAAADKEGLRRFFENWRREVRPLALTPKTNPVVMDVYDIYRAFFDPINLAKAGHPEWGDDIYKKTSYIIVQDGIAYRLGSNRNVSMKWISDFRPVMRLHGTKALYLTPVYKEAISAFLGEASPRYNKRNFLGMKKDYVEIIDFQMLDDDVTKSEWMENIEMAGSGNMMSPARARDEAKKRLEFLNQFVNIYPGHWGGWMLETHPKVTTVEVNEVRTKAIIKFRLIYQGGEAFLVKENGQWKIQDSRLTWIE